MVKDKISFVAADLYMVIRMETWNEKDRNIGIGLFQIFSVGLRYGKDVISVFHHFLKIFETNAFNQIV